MIKQKGTALVISFIIMGVLMLLGLYFLSFTLTESRIARSQIIGTQVYYLAEAGINKAIWKLKYDDKDASEDGDDPWATCFVTTTDDCPSCSATWTDSFTISTDALIPNSTTSVTIVRPECARAKLIATSTIALGGGRAAQRVVKTTVYKSLASPTAGAAVFSGGSSENIDIKASKMLVYGNLFSNNNLSITYASQVEAYATGTGNGKLLAEGNYKESDDSTVIATAICAKDKCWPSTTTCSCAKNPEDFQECSEVGDGRCPPKAIATPIVDFDSDSQYSFKERASSTEAANQCSNTCNGGTCLCDDGPCWGNNKCVLDDDDFEDLLWAAGEEGTLTLGTTSTPTIVYVTGSIELRGGRHLVVNGALVADDNITIGRCYGWGKDEGYSQITVNRPTDTTVSGLLTKRRIDFDQYSSFTTTTITGVVYANKEISLISMPNYFRVRGGIIGMKLDFDDLWRWLEFILDDTIIRYGLGWKDEQGNDITPTYSPIITVEYWEEIY